MLVSHSHKFIYTKTRKTASTSIEIYFEKFCVPPEIKYRKRHHIPEFVSSYGIIGYRGNLQRPANCKWWNHMPARIISSQLGEEKWDDYFKFCTVRNPFDKLISQFHFKFLNSQISEYILHRRRTGTFGTVGVNLFNSKKGIISAFRIWVKSLKSVDDRDAYIIDNSVCMNGFIKYEDLEDNLRIICSEVNVPFELDRLEHFKGGLRDYSILLEDYYDNETIKHITKLYNFEMDYFGYTEPF